VAKIVEAHILELGGVADTAPRWLERVDRQGFKRIGRPDNPFACLVHAVQERGGNRANRLPPAAGLGVADCETLAGDVDVSPPQAQDLATATSGQHKQAHGIGNTGRDVACPLHIAERGA